MPGDRSNQGLAIEGPGWNGAAITQTGSPTSLIAFSGSTPGGSPSEAPLVLEGFTLNGVAKTANGILLDGLAMWTLRGVQLSSFGAGIKLSSSLLGLIDGCQSGNNNYGVLAVRNGSGSGCNSNVIQNSEFNINSTQGIHLASGNDWLISGCQIEANGTAGDLTTGAVRIAATIDDEIGLAEVVFQSIHLENSLGQPFQVDNTTGLFLEINGATMIGGESHRELRVQGASNIALRNIIAGTGDVFDITANVAVLENVQVSTLTDSGVVYSIYNGVKTASTTLANGRVDSFTGTLTAVTGTPTATIGVRQQGDAIWLTVPTGGLLGASTTTTAPTITGLPAKYTPSADRQVNCAVIDNSASKGGVITVGASGVITLIGFGGFTASGNKGLPAITVGPYFL
jgi:hypothetical protein